MKKSIKLLGIAIFIFGVFCWLQSCDGTDFSSDSAIETIDQPVEEEPPIKDINQEPIKVEPVVPHNKKVKVCMAYVGLYGVANPKASDHYCDNAKFKVFFNDSETAETTELDLRNSSVGRDVNLITGGVLKVDFDFRDKTNDIDASFSEEKKQLIIEHRKLNHVPGIPYETKWKKGKLKVKTECAVKSCAHNGELVSISMIGEVEMSDGSKKYLSKELVTLPATNGISTKEYKFEDFDLVDDKPEFDDYCGVKVKSKKD